MARLGAAAPARWRTRRSLRITLPRSLVLTLALAGAPPSLHAQEPPNIEDVDVRVNYVYATQFGFGGYEVGGLRVGVYSLPIGFTFDDVLADWDLQLDLPVTYGRFRFSDSVVEDGQRVTLRTETNTIAAEPLLQLDIPIPALPGFRVSPLAAFGFGTTFSSEKSVEEGGVRQSLPSDEDVFYTYQVGLSSVYLHRWHDFTFAFGNAFIYAGNATFDGEPDDVVEGYGTYLTGVEARHPLGFQIADFIPDVGVFFVYHLFTPGLEFTRIGETALEVDQIFEMGGTIGATDTSEIHWLPGFLNRALNKFSIGVGYQTGEELDGFRITFGYPF
jgi:hypothetical protein